MTKFLASVKENKGLGIGIAMGAIAIIGIGAAAMMRSPKIDTDDTAQQPT